MRRRSLRSTPTTHLGVESVGRFRRLLLLLAYLIKLVGQRLSFRQQQSKGVDPRLKDLLTRESTPRMHALYCIRLDSNVPQCDLQAWFRCEWLGGEASGHEAVDLSRLNGTARFTWRGKPSSESKQF